MLAAWVRSSRDPRGGGPDLLTAPAHHVGDPLLPQASPVRRSGTASTTEAAVAAARCSSSGVADGGRPSRSAGVEPLARRLRSPSSSAGSGTWPEAHSWRARSSCRRCIEGSMRTASISSCRTLAGVGHARVGHPVRQAFERRQRAVGLQRVGVASEGAEEQACAAGRSRSTLGGPRRARARCVDRRRSCGGRAPRRRGPARRGARRGRLRPPPPRRARKRSADRSNACRSPSGSDASARKARAWASVNRPVSVDSASSDTSGRTEATTSRSDARNCSDSASAASIGSPSSLTRSALLRTHTELSGDAVVLSRTLMKVESKSKRAS